MKIKSVPWQRMSELEKTNYLKSLSRHLAYINHCDWAIVHWAKVASESGGVVEGWTGEEVHPTASFLFLRFSLVWAVIESALEKAHLPIEGLEDVIPSDDRQSLEDFRNATFHIPPAIDDPRLRELWYGPHTRIESAENALRLIQEWLDSEMAH
ncbi:hypothetical protein ACFL6R_06680 [Gemmatimonadota bacterium]